MFTLYDNRQKLYQWDLNRKVIVDDPAITEVHFCNRTSDLSLVTETYYLADANVYVADIPNEILQYPFDIRVYGYCTDYTKVEEILVVKARTRPADYVYTETEVKSYEALDQRVTHLEEHPVSDEALANSVETYLANNPIEVDLSDYYTKGETDTAIQTAVDAIDIPEVDFTGYATEDYVNDAVANVTVDLTGYATEQYVDDAIANLDIPEADVDLSDYYTKTETDALLETVDAEVVISDDGEGNVTIAAGEGTGNGGGNTNVDLSDYYTKEETDNAIKEAADFSNYYNKTETENLVNNAVGNISVPTELSQLNNDVPYATEQYVMDYVANNTSGGSSGGECNIPVLPDGDDIDISNMEPGMYAIKSNVRTLSEIYCTELNAHVSLQWWVSNGMLLIRDKNVVAWGQDNADIMFYVFSMNDYVDQDVTISPTNTLTINGWTDTGATHLEDIVHSGTIDYQYLDNYASATYYFIGAGVDKIQVLRTTSPHGFTAVFTANGGCTVTKYSDEIWRGDDCADGEFTPVGGTTYEVFTFKNNLQEKVIHIVMDVTGA